MLSHHKQFVRNLFIIGLLYLLTLVIALQFQPVAAGAAATGVVSLELDLKVDLNLDSERCPNFDQIRELSFWDAKSGFAYETSMFTELVSLFKTVYDEDFNYHAYDNAPRGSLSPVWSLYLDNSYTRSNRFYIIVYKGIERDKIYPAVWSYTRMFGDEGDMLDSEGLPMRNHPDCGWFSVDSNFMNDAMLLIHQEMMKQDDIANVVGVSG